jgi:drug/metabolite transporter (DMT)-like permease
MTAFYYLGLFLCGAAGTFAMQKYGRDNRSYQSIFVYACVTGLMAMGIFWAMSGFTLELSGRSILYAALYAVLALVSYFTNLPAYRYLGVSQVGVLSTGGRLIFSMLAGCVLFGERLTWISALRMALMLAAAVLLFFEDRKGTAEKEARRDRKLPVGVLLCIVLIVEGTLAGVLSKYIALDPLVPDANSLFFMTNFVIAAVSLLSLPLFCHGRIGACVSEFRSIAPMQYLMILLSTAASNVCSLLGVLILAADALTLYVPLSGALSILSTEAVAVLVVRERPRILPVMLACGAMLLAFFE